MTQPWNAARAASKRPLRKPYKPVAPVGPTHGELITAIVTGEIPTPNWRGCKGCGYHVCSCELPRTCATCGLTKEPEGFGDGNVCLACDLQCVVTLKSLDHHDREHGYVHEVPGQAFALKAARAIKSYAAMSGMNSVARGEPPARCYECRCTMSDHCTHSLTQRRGPADGP